MSRPKCKHALRFANRSVLCGRVDLDQWVAEAWCDFGCQKRESGESESKPVEEKPFNPNLWRPHQ